jgi:hypothetical protein
VLARSESEEQGSDGEPFEEKGSPERLEHLRWSSDLLWSAFEHETERTDRIRDQASAAFLALPVFVGLAMQSSAWNLDNPGVKACRVLTFACAAWALVSWYLVARVDYHPRLSVELFDAKEERARAHDATPLVARIKGYLLKAVDDGQKRGSDLARKRRLALIATVVTMVFAGLPMLLKELI